MGHHFDNVYLLLRFGQWDPFHPLSPLQRNPTRRFPIPFSVHHNGGRTWKKHQRSSSHIAIERTLLSQSCVLWGMIKSVSLGFCFQESSHSCALLPSLISQKLCCWIKSLCCLAAFQIKDHGPTSLSQIKSSTSRLLAYFDVQRIA